mmetsp:Transcript_10357/g.36405  ORF Transcript_10357/g.36405 Transcript_10357/m.36405 type:complete len:717 (+) Transcript_10357:844-2994(+)
MEGWAGPIIKNLQENPRRIVVPSITALDPDTWQEISPYGGGTKMCLTWNADFVWCNSYPGPYVPIMSGGLLAITRFWWEETGGYDEHMLSWGGENLDQSLRTWLCGGEIMVAEGSRVAHMWRDPAKPKTMLHYAIPTDHVRRNRLRASQAWLGPWAEKVKSFPEFEDFLDGGRLEVGDLSNVESFRKRLKCHGFEEYLDRFQDLYFGTGRLPSTTFHLRERTTGFCLNLVPGWHGSQKTEARFVLAPCSARSELQKLHGSNMNPQGGCCSGLQVWNWDHCMAVYERRGSVNADSCEGAGDVIAQRIRLDEGGALVWEDRAACIAPKEVAPSHDAQAAPPKAVLREACRAKVEDDAASGGFRVVLPAGGDHGAGVPGQRLCLAVPAVGTPEDAHGAALRFLPCEAVPDASLFARGLPKGDGRHQIKAPQGLCLDAASGQGLISYLCANLDQANPNQLFAAMQGDAFRWNAKALGSEVDWCVDGEGFDGQVVELAPCSTSSEAAGTDGLPAEVGREAALNEVPKLGQGFARVSVDGEDGVFELREAVEAHEGEHPEVRCLTHVSKSGEMVLTAAPCSGTLPSQRWRFQEPSEKGDIGGKLKAASGNLCIDAGSTKPLLFACMPGHDFLGQRWVLHRNGWIEAPRYWADNGRKKLAARCLDSRPFRDVELVGAECRGPEQASIVWEKLWETTPLETRLLQEAHSAKAAAEATKSEGQEE